MVGNIVEPLQREGLVTIHKLTLKESLYIYFAQQTRLCSPDDALVVGNIYIEIL